VPAIFDLAPQALRVSSPAELQRHLFHNFYFAADAAFVLRSRMDETPVAAGILVVNPGYADPHQLDASMPCYRLGAFGTEGMSAKRVHGLFSFLVKNHSGAQSMGLDLLAHAALRVHHVPVDTFAAQVPSDVPHLLRFYQQ